MCQMPYTFFIHDPVFERRAHGCENVMNCAALPAHVFRRTKFLRRDVKFRVNRGWHIANESLPLRCSSIWFLAGRSIFRWNEARVSVSSYTSRSPPDFIRTRTRARDVRFLSFFFFVFFIFARRTRCLRRFTRAPARASSGCAAFNDVRDFLVSLFFFFFSRGACTAPNVLKTRELGSGKCNDEPLCREQRGLMNESFPPGRPSHFPSRDIKCRRLLTAESRERDEAKDRSVAVINI